MSEITGRHIDEMIVSCLIAFVIIYLIESGAAMMNVIFFLLICAGLIVAFFIGAAD